MPSPDYQTWSDAELSAAIAIRDSVAYGELYRRHAGSVRSVARMVLGSRADCDDVVAEVFVRLWTSPGQFDPDRGSLLGFLRLRAKGRSIDILRCESNRKRREDNDAYSDNLPGPDVESTVIAAEAAAELARAIAALPASEQEPIRLAYFGGMSYRAVALHLEEPEGTVKSRIRVGLQHLRSRTGELGSA